MSRLETALRPRWTPARPPAWWRRRRTAVRIFLSQVQRDGPASVEAMTAFWRATAPA